MSLNSQTVNIFVTFKRLQYIKAKYCLVKTQANENKIKDHTSENVKLHCGYAMQGNVPTCCAEKI